MPQNILIIGATGLIGRPITQAFIEAMEHFSRIAIFTSPSTVEDKSGQINWLRSKGVEVLVGDMQNEHDIKEAYANVDTVVSCLGRTVIAKQIELIKWASETPNVTRFLPSEYGTDIEYSPQSAEEKPHQQKLKVRAFMKMVKDLEWTYLVTGPYPDLFIRANPGNEEIGTFNLRKNKAVLLGDGEQKIGFTAMADVGKLVVAALLHPEASKNKTLKVNSFYASQNEILAELEKQFGQKLDVSHTPLARVREIEAQAWADDNVLMGTGATLRRIWAEGGTVYEKTDNELLGSPQMETLEDQIRQAIPQCLRAREGLAASILGLKKDDKL